MPRVRFGAGFSQGLSGVLTSGLPLLIQQRLSEAKLKQEEEELKVRKKLVQAQAEHLQSQSAKSLREAMVAGQLGQAFEAMGGKEIAGGEAGPPFAETPTPKGKLARLLAEGGQAKEALGLFPELTRDPEGHALMRQLTRGVVGGEQTGAAGGGPIMGPAGAPGMPGAAGGGLGRQIEALHTNERDPNTYEMAIQRDGNVQIMKRKISVNINDQGKQSVQVTMEPTDLKLESYEATLPDGRKQLMHGFLDPTRGWVTPPRPVGAPASPEWMQRVGSALTEGYGLKPGTPLYKAAFGQTLIIHGVTDEKTKQQMIEELNTLLRGIVQHVQPTATGAEARPAGLGAPDIAGARRRGEEAKTAETERLAGARERGARAEQALQGADRVKYEMLVGAERQGDLVAKLFRPEFVGKGFSAGLTRAWNEQEGAARKGRYVPGGLAGALREWFGSASPEEIQFRRATSDVADQILRARSGAQINEREYERLKKMLFRVTDEPATFLPALSRFREELGHQIDDVRSTASKSAGQLQRERQTGKSGGPPAKLQTFPEPMVVEDPAGKRYRLKPGEQLPEGWRLLGPYPKGRR